MTDEKCVNCGKTKEEHFGYNKFWYCDESFKNGFTPQKTKQGCGKEFMYIPFLNDKRICGQIEDLKHSDNILLCPSCQTPQKTNSQKEEIRTKELRRIKELTLKIDNSLKENLNGFLTKYTEKIIEICNEDLPYKETIEEIRNMEESKIFWESFKKYYYEDNNFRNKADDIFGDLYINNTELCSYCGNIVIDDNKEQKREKIGVVQIGTGKGNPLRSFCNKDCYNMWKNKINTQSQPKTQESSNHVVGRASRIADNTQTPPTLKDDLEKLKIFYSNSLEAEKRDVVEFIEKDLILSLKRLRDEIHSWKETGIKDGKIQLMITNGGYINKFEVIKIIDEIMGDFEK